MGLFKISESFRAYAYLILSSQASARSSIVGNTTSALTAQSTFLNNFENVVTFGKILKDILISLGYTSSKVDYSVGENVYMLPSNMTLKIKTGTVRYNHKILVSSGNFSLGKNDEVNSLETPVMKNHKNNSLEAQSTPQVEPTTIESHSNTAQGLTTHAPTISYEDVITIL